MAGVVVGTIASFLPILLIAAITAGLFYRIVKRKGRSPLWLISFLFPVIGFFVVIWIVSLTDKDLLDRLAKLEAVSTFD